MAWLDSSEPEECDEQDVDEQGPTKLTAFYAIVATLPVLMFFDYLGRFDLGLNVCMCLSINILVITVRWKLHKHPWFWGAMTVVLALELPAILLVKWPPHWVSAVELLPIGVGAYLIAAGAIQLAEKLFDGSGSIQGS